MIASVFKQSAAASPPSSQKDKIIANSGIVRDIGISSLNFDSYITNRGIKSLQKDRQSVRNSIRLSESANNPMNSIITMVHPMTHYSCRYRKDEEKEKDCDNF